jgi:hypothetical protein
VDERRGRKREVAGTARRERGRKKAGAAEVTKGSRRMDQRSLKTD